MIDWLVVACLVSSGTCSMLIQGKTKDLKDNAEMENWWHNIINSLDCHRKKYGEYGELFGQIRNIEYFVASAMCNFIRCQRLLCNKLTLPKHCAFRPPLRVRHPSSFHILIFCKTINPNYTIAGCDRQIGTKKLIVHEVWLWEIKYIVML